MLNTFSTCKMKAYALCGLVFLFELFAIPSRAEADDRFELAIEDVWSVPLSEISGLALTGQSLLLASDDAIDLLTLPWPTSPALFRPGAGKPLALRPASLAAGSHEKKSKAKNKFKLRGASQWEGLATDGQGKVVALREKKSLVFVFSAEGESLRRYSLLPLDPQRDRKKGLEGLVLLRSSHLLVALSAPPTLIEYGPAGDKPLGFGPAAVLGVQEDFVLSDRDELVPLASWGSADNACQLGDLARDASGSVYALLKDCSRIIRIAPAPVTQKTFSPDRTWTYPRSLDHAEGLLVLSESEFLLARDSKSLEKNLFRLQPKKNAPKP